MENKDDYLSLSDAARLTNVSRQAIFCAVKKGSLKSTSFSRGTRNEWKVSKKDLKEYRKNLYSRDKSMYEGKPLYQPELGIYSLSKAADYLNVSYLHLYYNLQRGRIKASRKGCAWIFKEEDLITFKSKYLCSNKSEVV